MQLQPVASSNIRGIGYDEAQSCLYVEFTSGARYKYEGVAKDEYEGFLGAGSKGQYFAKNIKDVYSYARV